jgi:hypothetical protein
VGIFTDVLASLLLYVGKIQSAVFSINNCLAKEVLDAMVCFVLNNLGFVLGNLAFADGSVIWVASCGVCSRVCWDQVRGVSIRNENIFGIFKDESDVAMLSAPILSGDATSGIRQFLK